MNIRNEIQQLNQIEVMSCNRWQFQELHRLYQELKKLAQEERTEWTELAISCEAGGKVHSLLWQQIRKEMSKKKTKADKANRIKLHIIEKEKALR